MSVSVDPHDTMILKTDKFRISQTSKVFFFQARGYSILTFVATHCLDILEMAKTKSKYKERIRKGPSFPVCDDLFLHVSRVNKYFNKGISGLAEALEFQDVCDVRLWLTSIMESENNKSKEV